MVAADCGALTIEGDDQRDLADAQERSQRGSGRRCRRKDHQGEGSNKLMEGYREVASETGDAQVSGGTRGKTTRERYYGIDTGDAHVGG